MEDVDGKSGCECAGATGYMRALVPAQFYCDLIIVLKIVYFKNNICTKEKTTPNSVIH